jgi:hypothetical protein
MVDWLWASRILTGISRFPTVVNGYEDATHITGALIDCGGRRLRRYASAFERAIVQHGRRDG